MPPAGLTRLRCSSPARRDIRAQLLSREAWCDADLVCPGQTFPTHRLVLGALSDWCRRLMAELPGQTRLVLHLPDFQPTEVEALLSLVYGTDLSHLRLGPPTPLMTCLGIRLAGGVQAPAQAPAEWDEAGDGSSEADDGVPEAMEAPLVKVESVEAGAGPEEPWGSRLAEPGLEALAVAEGPPLTVANYRTLRRQMGARWAGRALVGLRRDARGAGWCGRLLARSQPEPGAMRAQFAASAAAMRAVGGLSRGDVGFQTAFFTRQGWPVPAAHGELRDTLQAQMEKLPIDQLQKITSSDKIRRVRLRSEPRPGADLPPVAAIRLTLDLAPSELEQVVLLACPSHASPTLVCHPIRAESDRMADSARLWVDVLLDVWCPAPASLQGAEFLLEQFESVAEPMSVFQAAQGVLNGREVTCPECGRVFSLLTVKKRVVYQEHKDMHRLEGFACDCPGVPANVRDKANHVKLCHSQGRYQQCGECDFIGSTGELSQHQARLHQSYICDVCGQVSENLKKHQVHIQNHKVSQCDECGKECLGPSTLSRHKSNVHGQEIPCEDCGKSFKGRLRWRRHLKRTHEDDARFICDLCGQAFGRKMTMKRHKISVHIKNRPFVCRYGCGADYNDECNLRTHEKRRHGGTFKDGQSFMHVYKNIA
eukprot:snap_masked-scaffold1193_size56161-processed-gene-0.0 protein:Tk04083 transcript:snap_masked-scaffold1193_size56161-processed-gene-0.0-mRNA-1 annotation:"zinc imprinted isoform cra_a"